MSEEKMTVPEEARRMDQSRQKKKTARAALSFLILGVLLLGGFIPVFFILL